MKRILLLYASVGMGHQSAALALARAFEQLPNTSVMVEDTLRQSLPLFRRGYAGIYLRISDKAPDFWSFFYARTDRPSGLVAGARALSTSVGVRGLPALLEHARPDAIICTHFLPIEALALMRRDVSPIYCVLTDYHAHQFWACPSVARYFVPTDATRSEMVAAGAPAERVYVSGIPIDPAIGAPADRETARRQIGLPADRPVVALLGSGLPIERVRAIALALPAELRQPTTVVVATGRNRALAERLADLEQAAGGALRVLGPQPSLDPLIVASDLVLSKAGGLTVSEVLARGVPLLLPMPMAGQERWNADYVIGAGAGLGRESARELAAAAADLLVDPARRAAMAAAARAAARPAAAQHIAARVLADLEYRAPTLHQVPNTVLGRYILHSLSDGRGYSSPMRLANSLGDRPGMPTPWWGRSLYSARNSWSRPSNSAVDCQILSASHALRVRTNRSAIPLDCGRCRAINTWMNSCSWANWANTWAVKWVPRSEIKNCSSGGSRVRRASTTIAAVTLAPATKSGNSMH